MLSENSERAGKGIQDYKNSVCCNPQKRAIASSARSQLREFPCLVKKGYHPYHPNKVYKQLFQARLQKTIRWN
jgi:hypothetical protein